MQGLKASTYRKEVRHDKVVASIIADWAALRGITLKDELPAELTHAELLKRAGA